MKANIGIGEKQRDSLGTILNALLADEFVIYVKTRRFHWPGHCVRREFMRRFRWLVAW